MSISMGARTSRYWSKREGSYCVDECGFLVDPVGLFGVPLSPGLARLADLEDRDCLVLLGEPGMGNTTALEAEREQRECEIGTSGGSLIWRDLGEFGDETRLIRDLFEAPEWDRWRAGDRTLYLYLDALDECRLHLPNVAAVILGQLRRLPRRDRLKFRIACRTGAWPPGLEAGLKGLWPGDRTGVFELVPLRRRDVEAIAAAAGLKDVGAFLRDVERRDAGPLAAKPVTLKLLLNIYRRGGQLPHSPAELYECGCRALCEEANEARLAAEKHGVLGVEERLAVAARIAAATVFCGGSAAWDGPGLTDRPEDDMAVPDLCGGVEHIQGVDLKVTEAGVREVLSDTGLFSSRGPRRLGWAHRTFAEYLAARYLVARGLGVEQVKGLILHPHMPGRVVPQLQQATAWLAGMNPGVFRAILASDPEVLVRSDVENASTDDREALVAALLNTASEGRLGVVGLDAGSERRKLKHPRLAAQLGPFIADRSAGLSARRVAIEIARACEVRELQGPLADLVLDRSQELTSRVKAGYAVWTIGDEATRRRMRPLLAADLDEDVEDELKGCALTSLWPGLISAEEAFRAITHPKREHFYGAYAGFMMDSLVRGLDRADLALALRWAARQSAPRRLAHIIRLVIDQIVLRAWDEIEVPEVAETLAEIVWTQVESHADVADPFSGLARAGPFGADIDRRRRLVLALVPKLTSVAAEPGRLCYSRPPLLAAEDLPWLIGLLDLEGDAARRTVLARLVRAVFLLAGPKSPDEVLAAAERHLEIADAIQDLISPVVLDSSKAVAARGAYANWVIPEQRSNAERRLSPPPREWVERLLAREQEGDPDAWWQLTLVMTVEPTSSCFKDAFRSDLTALPGWREADAGTKARIVDAAHRYVLGHRPSPQEWFFEEGTTYLPDETGLKALRLLCEQAPDRFDALGPDVWGKWSPVIVGYTKSGSHDDEEAQRRLAGHAYRNAPEELLGWLARWLEEQGRREHPFISARLWADLPEPALNGVLMERVRDPSTSVRVIETLLDDLLARDVPEAREFATSLLVPPHLEDSSQRERSRAAASSLLTCSPDAGWPALWPVLLADSDFGRDLVDSIAPRFDRAGLAPFLDRLSEAQVADFYVWLARRFPHHEDEKDDGFHAVGLREYAAWLRDGVLRHLEWRGTATSLVALDAIARELPNLDWLPLVRLQAEKVVMERTWVPHRPEDLWTLAGDREARLVDGGDQLLDVVVESLGRYQRKLRGETPASFMLWDRQKDGKFRPKEEERLSDALKLHLTEDLTRHGVVANREVVIRSGTGGKAGERTDIHVDAITRGPRTGAFDRVAIVVEVKGYWNRDVLTAMEEQLRDRYLAEGGCRHGLYVVGWFPFEQWDADDYRRGDARRQHPATLDEARSHFFAQAAGLSDGSRRVRAVVLDCSLT
jgi:hypothetical protein